MVLAGIALWGRSHGMTQGLLAAMVSDFAPEYLRGTAFGFFNLVSGLAMLAASVISGEPTRCIRGVLCQCSLLRSGVHRAGMASPTGCLSAVAPSKSTRHCDARLVAVLPRTTSTTESTASTTAPGSSLWML